MNRVHRSCTARLLGATGLLTLGAVIAVADVPRLISYQGKLAGQTSGPVDLTVTFYDDPVAGAALFTETHTNVPLNNGVFSIQIGSQTVGGVPDGALDAAQVWVGVAVDANPELTPRTPLTMVPYAAKARSSERLVRPDGFTGVAQTRTNTGLSFAIGNWPLITAGHDNGVGREKRMWIGHSENFPTWGIQYRDTTSDGFPADSIEFVAGDQTEPRFGFELFTGRFRVYDGTGSAVNNLVLLDADNGGGTIGLYNNSGSRTVELDGDAAGGGALVLDNASGVGTVAMFGESGTTGGALELYDNSGTLTISLHGNDKFGTGAFLKMFNNAGNQTIDFDSGSTSGQMAVMNDGTFGVVLGASFGGTAALYNTGGTRTVLLAGDETGSGALNLYYDDGTTAGIELDVEGTSAEATISLRNAAGFETVRIAADEASDGGDIALRNAAGVQTCQLDADYGGTGMSRLRVDVVEILGGSDISEQFDIGGGEIRPGMVVCIDPANPGKLSVSAKAYDRTVAGVVSGAGGVNPGFLMSQRGSVADGKHPVALTGRVWVHCDASNGAIQPGDLLTTSDVPGHAMKVSDHDKARGAILGKAMTPLAEGRGLVLVLVSLQ